MERERKEDVLNISRWFSLQQPRQDGTCTGRAPRNDARLLSQAEKGQNQRRKTLHQFAQHARVRRAPAPLVFAAPVRSRRRPAAAGSAPESPWDCEKSKAGFLPLSTSVLGRGGKSPRRRAGTGEWRPLALGKAAATDNSVIPPGPSH